MTTPADEAKKYAAQHGFTITPNGRRYCVSHPGIPSFERGGYAAVLNEMRVLIGTLGDAEAMMPVIATGTRLDELAKLPIRCNGPKCTSNGETPHSAECGALHDATVAGVDLTGKTPRPYQVRFEGAKPVASYAEAVAEFAVFDELIQARIRNKAASIRAAEHKPYVITRVSKRIGVRVDMLGEKHLTYHEAITRVRQLFNVKPELRKAALRVEYRP